MDAPITVGIVGYGLIGRTHARALRDVDGAALAGVVTRRGREQVAGEAGPDLTGVAIHDSLGAMLSDAAPDVVAICSPSGLHGQLARTALEHGAHVLVEKPPAGSITELRDLARLADSNGRHLAVVSQQRMESHPAFLAQVVRSGELGTPRLGEVRLHWHRPQSYYDRSPWRSSDPHGGSLANQGWHAVDLLAWLFGPVSSVSAQTATIAHRIEVEDTSVAAIRFRNGALGSIVTSTATPPGEPAEIRLFFEKGAVRMQDTTIVEWSAPEHVSPPPAAESAASGASDPAAIGAVGHRRLWQDLVDAVLDGVRPAVTAADSAPTLALVEAVYRAADSGVAIEIGGETS